VTTAHHMLETTQGDELVPEDLAGATYKVTETYVDLDTDTGELVFTHRIELHMTDDQVLAMIPNPEDPCPRGTPGCSSTHDDGDTPCATW
jgi:hypothetical protein